MLLAWRGTEGLASQRRLTDTLVKDIIATQHASADMITAMDGVHAAALTALATRDSDRQGSLALMARLSDDLIPAADADLAAVRQLHAGDDGGRAAVHRGPGRAVARGQSGVELDRARSTAGGDRDRKDR